MKSPSGSLSNEPAEREKVKGHPKNKCSGNLTEIVGTICIRFVELKPAKRRCLTEAGDRRERARARREAVRARELDVAREVVDGRNINTANTVRAEVRDGVRADDELDLAENTGRAEERLAHVLENTTTRSVEERGRGRALRLDIGGDEGGRIRAVVLVERRAGVTDRDVVTRVGRDLLCVRCEGRHTSILVSEKINLQKSVVQTERPETMDPTSQAPPTFVLPNTTSNFVAGFNGRVNLDARPSAGGFLADPAKGGFGYRTAVNESASQDLMRGNWMDTTLSQAFFSPENTKMIQNAIRKTVQDRSGEKQWVIDEQSADELQIVMRSLYLQYAKNLEYDIPGQIQKLNSLVVEWSVPRIMSEISMQQQYLKDISTLPTPLPQPMQVSSAGTKSLPFRQFM